MEQSNGSWMKRVITAGAVVLIGGASLPACDDPVEEAAEERAEAIEETQPEAVQEQVEEAAERMEEAADEVEDSADQDAVEEAAETQEDVADEVEDEL